MYDISKKYFQVLLFLIKLLVLGFASFLIYERIWNHGEFDLLMQLSFLQKPSGMGLLCLILIFGCANWTLEILKWKSLVCTRRPIGFREAAKQSFASLTVSLATPNRIGEYGAKVAYFPKNDRKHVLLFNFLGNMSQLAVTLVFGIAGFFALQRMPDEGLASFLLESDLLALSILMLLVLFLAIPILIKLGKRMKLSNPLDRKDWARLFGLSLLKYLAFSHQFYFMLLLFGADLGYGIIMPTLFLVYLIASAIPGFLLFDWMIKGSVAVTLFGLAGTDELLVLSVTSLMWVMNFGIPSMLGAYHVLRFKTVNLKDVKISTQ